MTNAKLVGIGSYIPQRVITNDFFINKPYKVFIGLDKDQEPIFAPETRTLTNQGIIETTGIEQRRRARDNEQTSDLAAYALQNALKNAHMSPDDLEGIIVATVTPDKSFPSTACEVQRKILAKNAHSYDINAACSGFCYALDQANNAIKQESGPIAVIGAETLTRVTDYEELNCDLFGDLAGAVILAPTQEKGTGILATSLYSDPFDGKDMYIFLDKKGYLRMPQGRAVFKQAVEAMLARAGEVKQKANIGEKDVKLHIPHQANLRILQYVSQKIDPQNPKKVFVNIQKYGNTSSATCPVALEEAIKEGRAKDGDIIILESFGSGLVSAAVAIKL